MTHNSLASLSALALSSAILVSCDAGGLPMGLSPTITRGGPVVRFDLEARPLPEVPLPNDLATWPDPTSPTGRRVNASFIAPTTLESNIRRNFGELDGWGVYAPISVGFDRIIDTDNLLARQGGGSAAFSETQWQQHAVYLINMETGIPVPLEVNGTPTSHFHYVTEQTGRYFPSDPRAAEAQILFESVEEDINGNGVMDLGEDTDFDGVLDHPNTLSGRAGATPDLTYDDMMWFYERETNTMIVRPLVPLQERTEYAVVLTTRLTDSAGLPVESPFPSVHHISQTESLRRLPELLRAHPEVYGTLASTGFQEVAFSWTFTTQTVETDLHELREGLYGRGRFDFLEEQFPPDLSVGPTRGGTCPTGEPGDRTFLVEFEDLLPTLRTLAGTVFMLEGEALEQLLASLSNIDHIVLTFFESPYLLGDPSDPRADARFQLDATARARTTHRELIPMLLIVPKETAEHQQPFPVSFYGHGYTSSYFESLGFAGWMAQNGVASAAIDAEGHGLAFPRGLRVLFESIFRNACLEPMGRMLAVNRAQDLDGDETPDAGGNFWSAYVFHTRDVVRQSVLDHMQAIRVLRHFGAVPGEAVQRRLVPRVFEVGTTRYETTGDLNGDGEIELAGDFDGDGTIDMGGWDGNYSAWGQSLGGFISSILIGSEPMVRAAAPTSGGAGLTDVSVRSQISQVRDAVYLRTMGPLIISEPAGATPRASETACRSGERRLFTMVPSTNKRVDVEFACLPATELDEGDAVVVRNLNNREVRCAGVGPEGRFRVAVPSDADDAWQVEIVRGARMTFDYATCSDTSTETRATRQVSTFEVGNGESFGAPPDARICDDCARYQQRTWEIGDPLVAPTEGFGLRRQSPELRRFLALAQIAVEPGDPVNYVRHVFQDPITSEDATYRGPRSLLVASGVGDPDVPVSAGNAMARVAGILAFMPPDAPDVFAEYRAPADFADTYSVATPEDVLNRFHVLEGTARLNRHPVEGATNFLADVDDLGDGRQLYTEGGGFGGTIAPVRSSPALRWTRESLAMSSGGTFSPAVGSYEGISGVLNVYVNPRGNHGTELPDSNKTWDEGIYYANLVAHYFQTGGASLLYHEDPIGHRCLEDSSCSFFDR